MIFREQWNTHCHNCWNMQTLLLNTALKRFFQYLCSDCKAQIDLLSIAVSLKLLFLENISMECIPFSHCGLSSLVRTKFRYQLESGYCKGLRKHTQIVVYMLIPIKLPVGSGRLLWLDRAILIKKTQIKTVSYVLYLKLIIHQLK